MPTRGPLSVLPTPETLSVDSVLTELADVWGPADAPRLTHFAWRRVGIGPARQLCATYGALSTDEQAVVARYCRRGWLQHFCHFMHAAAEEAVRRNQVDHLGCVVVAFALIDEFWDYRDVINVLFPFRRSCRRLGHSPGAVVNATEDAVGAGVARALNGLASTGLSRIGLRFHGWREVGPTAELEYVDVVMERARRGGFPFALGSRAEQLVDEWAFNPDPGPPPDRLPSREDVLGS